MKRGLATFVTLLVLLAAGLWFALRVPAGPVPVATNFTLTDVEIVEPLRGRASGRSISVADGRIALIADAPPPASVVIDEYAGHFVLPGLIDMHTHLPSDTPLGLTEYFGLLYAAHGVTAVREAGDTDGTAIPAARRVFEERGSIGPRVFACGPFVGGENPRWKNSLVLARAEDAPAVVAELVERGSACVKSYDDLDPERIRTLVRASEAAGLPVIGHVPTGFSYEDVLVPDTQHMMGVPRPGDIERSDHVVFRIIDWRKVDEARMDEVVAAAAAHGLAFTPTIVSTSQLRHFADYEATRVDPQATLLPRMYRDVVWNPVDGLVFYRGFGAAEHEMIRDVHEKKLRMVAKLHAAGVALHLGTDTQQPFVAPGASMHTEMRLFAEGGIPAEQIWAYATWKSGRALRADGLGSLAEGAPADLLVFAQDPSRDLRALDSLQAVVIAGRLYTKAQIDESIARFREHYSSALVDAISIVAVRRVLAKTVQREN